MEFLEKTEISIIDFEQLLINELNLPKTNFSREEFLFCYNFIKACQDEHQYINKSDKTDKIIDEKNINKILVGSTKRNLYFDIRISENILLLLSIIIKIISAHKVQLVDIVEIAHISGAIIYKIPTDVYCVYCQCVICELDNINISADNIYNIYLEKYIKKGCFLNISDDKLIKGKCILKDNHFCTIDKEPITKSMGILEDKKLIKTISKGKYKLKKKIQIIR